MPYYDQNVDFVAEYAKTGRSNCRACHTAIAEKSLRLARMVQSPHFDGKIPSWYHTKCFWRGRTLPQSVSDIYGFSSLKFSDQEEIESHLNNHGPSGRSSSSSSSSAATGLRVEYAKSSRSECRGCYNRIERGEVRLGIDGVKEISAGFNIEATDWHHVRCFLNRGDYSAMRLTSISQLRGSDGLDASDREVLQAAIDERNGVKAGKGVKRQGTPKAKAKKKSRGSVAELEDPGEEYAPSGAAKSDLRRQSDRLFEVMSYLECLSRAELLEELQSNGFGIRKGGEDELRQIVTDCVVFGVPQRCSTCGGQFRIHGETYECGGWISGYTKCTETTRTPARTPWRFSDDLLMVHPELDGIEFPVGDRLFATVEKVKSAAKHEEGDEQNEVQPTEWNRVGDKTNTPLKGMIIGAIGRLSHTRPQLKQIISDAGGKLQDKVDGRVNLVISTIEELEKQASIYAKAKRSRLPVVNESFVTDCVVRKETLPLQSYLCHPEEASGFLSHSAGRKSVSSARSLVSRKSAQSSGREKLRVKNGVVAHDEELAEKAHIYVEGEVVYSETLSRTDAATGMNSYYILQLYESDSGTATKWGRTGNDMIGDEKRERMAGKESAIAQFEKLFEEKTGNPFYEVATGMLPFEMHAGKAFRLDTNIDSAGGGSGDQRSSSQSLVRRMSLSSGSSLPKAVANLVTLICDITAMEQELRDLEIDADKMPLGMISRRGLTAAFAVLREVQEELMRPSRGKGGPRSVIIADLTNRFYTMVPHSIPPGARLPLLNNLRLIDQKVDLVQSLMDLEVSFSVVSGPKAGNGADPVRAQYDRLGCGLSVIDRTSFEFELIEGYVNNTHAPTHTTYKLRVMNCFRVDRDGEDQRFGRHSKDPNRMLLWHGSRMTNWAGILPQGLRIAPPEAPVTGYMFGKGVYFADMVTKSANYCFASMSGDTGLLMLCEVALGKSLELHEALFVYGSDQEKPPPGFQGKKLPKSYRSTKGIGGTCPDPAGNYVTSDGCIVPRGKPVNNPEYKANGSLLYNEYVVYDVSQIKCKKVLQAHDADTADNNGIGFSFTRLHKSHRKLRLNRWRRSKWHKHHGGWPHETGRDAIYAIPSGPGGGPGGSSLTDNFAYLSAPLMKFEVTYPTASVGKYVRGAEDSASLCSVECSMPLHHLLSSDSPEPSATAFGLFRHHHHHPPSIFIIPSGGGCGCGGGSGMAAGFPFTGPIKLPNIAPHYHYHGRHYYGASEEALMCVFGLAREWLGMGRLRSRRVAYAMTAPKGNHSTPAVASFSNSLYGPKGGKTHFTVKGTETLTPSEERTPRKLRKSVPEYFTSLSSPKNPANRPRGIRVVQSARHMSDSPVHPVDGVSAPVLPREDPIGFRGSLSVGPVYCQAHDKPETRPHSYGAEFRPGRRLQSSINVSLRKVHSNDTRNPITGQGLEAGEQRQNSRRGIGTQLSTLIPSETSKWLSAKSVASSSYSPRKYASSHAAVYRELVTVGTMHAMQVSAPAPTRGSGLRVSGDYARLKGSSVGAILTTELPPPSATNASQRGRSVGTSPDFERICRATRSASREARRRMRRAQANAGRDHLHGQA
ncbi:poly ADP-ribose polymerase [Perkinsus chesapeaki]|uniref:Poly [ADP-ribose] polymerase n=1 Tax=Perkinsus chesapeaki TaxID=330153 RepID=A0A7J6MNG5_PERCH|nr:poly ADP-ribose polymerase [Perkinsus chesapeaki]